MGAKKRKRKKKIRKRKEKINATDLDNYESLTILDRESRSNNQVRRGARCRTPRPPALAAQVLSYIRWRSSEWV